MTVRSGRFGGFGLDRMLIDYEAIEAEPVEAMAPDEPTEMAEAPEAAPLPAWSADDPAFLDAVDARAAEVARGLMAQNQPQPYQQPEQHGEQIDPNEFLNPLADDFGQNFLTLMQQRDQYLLGQIDQRFAPIQQDREQAAMQAGQARVDEIVNDDLARHGGFPEDVAPQATEAIKQLAAMFLPEMEQTWGPQNPRAAEAAIRKSAQTVRGLVTAAMKAGATAETTTLANLGNARLEPGGNGTAISRPVPAGDEMEVARRYSGVQI